MPPLSMAETKAKVLDWTELSLEDKFKELGKGKEFEKGKGLHKGKESDETEGKQKKQPFGGERLARKRPIETVKCKAGQEG